MTGNKSSPLALTPTPLRLIRPLDTFSKWRREAEAISLGGRNVKLTKTKMLRNIVEHFCFI